MIGSCETVLLNSSPWEMERTATQVPIESPGTVISVKLQSEERAELAEAARGTVLIVTEFVRLAALAWCRGYERLESPYR